MSAPQTQDDCLFCQIVTGSIPNDTVVETERVLAFRDIQPQAPTHVLVIPKDHHATLAAVAVDDPQLASELLAVVPQVASAEGLEVDGYRVVANTGTHGQQTVHHVHLHVLGGRQLQWPPG
ncbi:histidine triad (HIT) family protein [Kytococcus aerolatus]|uniref:Histidine triad (HIT) family protein n=1 Tax=Kytococcus aerolatus TaxID=592308 RepID=A0A212U2B8_9MICO|nr:histidine triad nucleotide-binding protein [Kytococcus aerolatus]SNC72389.1 histidine triad (HIT) family protein [Kytococcus aerolatus]